MKKIFYITIISLLLTGCNSASQENIASINKTELDYETTNPVILLQIENYGNVIIELYPDIAPITVANFVSLTETGYYDNNTFHRLIPDFVLQGGDKTATGTGNPGYSISGEFESNGFTNELLHEEGIISMARSLSPDSAGSQFFIVLEEAPHLDGNYAAFGKVIDGMAIINTIEQNEDISNLDSGTLTNHLTITKALVDYNEYELIEYTKYSN